VLRDLLNDVPEWVLALCFVGVVVLLTLGALALVLRFLPVWRSQDAVEPILARPTPGRWPSSRRCSPTRRAPPPSRRFYGAATDQLNVFLAEREKRVAKAGTEIPVPLLALMIFLAIVTIAVSLLIKTHHRSVDIALAVVVAVVVASGS